MPTPQRVTARDRQSLDDSDTFVLDLRGYHGISAIELIIRATNGATSNQGNPIHLDVDTIEVVDGSRQITSLSGVQVRSLNCYELGYYPPVVYNEGAAAVQEETFRVMFGRELYDESYFLNPAMFNNPQLRVVVSLAISATVGFATGTGDITVIVHTWDEMPGGRQGHMEVLEHKAFTSAASGEDRTEVPIDKPIRMLILRAFETGIDLHTDVTRARLIAAGGQRELFDLRTEHWRDLVANRWPRFTIPQLVFRTDADAPQCFLAYPREFQANALQDFDVASIDARTVDQLTLQLLTLSATPTVAKSTTDRSINLVAKGYAPHFALAAPFGKLMVPDSWLDPAGLGKLELVLTQGGAGAAVSVFSQRVAA